MSDNKRMGLSIWFLCGVILVVFGLAVTVSGIYNAFNPPPVFGAELHLDIIWGLILTIVGAGFMFHQRPSKLRS